MSHPPRRVGKLVEHLFRHEAGRLVAVLTRKLGVEQIELVEDVVQEALLAALSSWPHAGVPSNPSGWLMRVARNRAIDRLRREITLRHKLERIQSTVSDIMRTPEPGSSIDDQLAMVFMCCHPTLSRDSQVALTLRTVSGFSVSEIARALLADDAAVTKRIKRARGRLRNEQVALAMPEPHEMPARLAAVCEVLYLLFNEGYGAHGGDNLTRSDLCDEAMRLADLLTKMPETDTPEVHALLALMCLQASRLPARTDEVGSLVLLADQNSSHWDSTLIETGMQHLDRAAVGTSVSQYHLEAGIAACHAAARDYDVTDWERILGLFDQLVELNSSPVVQMNRAVAVSKVHGPESAIELLERLESEKALRDYYLFPAVYGDVLAQVGRIEEALGRLRLALSLKCTAPEQRFLKRRIAELEGQAPSR